MLLQVIDSLCLLVSQSPFGVIEPGLLDLLGRSLIFHEARGPLAICGTYLELQSGQMLAFMSYG